MKDSVKGWYKEQFGNCYGNSINENATFKDLNNALKAHKGFYEILGVNNMVIEERVLHKIADLYYGGDYRTISVIRNWY